METFLYLFIHYILPLAFIGYVAIKKFKIKFGLLSTTVLTIAVLCFFYLWGQWAIVGSHYVRYILLLAILYVLYNYRQKNKEIAANTTVSWFIKTRNGIASLLSVYILYSCATILFANNNYDSDAVDLEFPLKGGEYYISSGGSNSLMNNHLRNYPSEQQYAIDINTLSAFKTISKGILSKENTDHYIFSETVYSPCDGTIQEVKNTVDDNLSSSMNVSSKDGSGNFIHLKCKDVNVYLLHLMKNSILVSNGQQVKAGHPLGQVGNSGFSQEPHLHIQASTYNADSTLVGIPMRFNGTILTKNTLVKN